MRSDGSVSRPRLVSRPKVKTCPLGRLKQELYELYLTVQPMSLDVIQKRIRELAAGNAASDPTSTPTTDTIRLVLSDSTLPSPHHVVAIVAALLNPHPVPGTTPIVRGNSEVEHFRDLWRAAAAHQPAGVLIATVSADDLEVHQAIPPATLPAYLVRRHDEVLREVVCAALQHDRSGIAMLISGSTSGKTRACYEVMHWDAPLKRARSLATAGWRLWPSVNPLPPDRFLDELAEVGPRTVIWLNEAQRYLFEPEHHIAEAIAFNLRALLLDESRAPVVLLGTLWPTYYDTIMRRPPSMRPDLHANARALIKSHTTSVPDAFTGSDLDAARASEDARVREAAEHGNAITQHLAGVPALMERYDHLTVTARAVLNAGMDARRFGHGERLSTSFLLHAAPAYLDSREQGEHLVAPDWFARAIDELTAPHTASTRLLHPYPVIANQEAGEPLRLEDYIDELGRRTRDDLFPSQGFWDAAVRFAPEANDHHNLARGARDYGRLDVAVTLFRMAVDGGHSLSPLSLLRLIEEKGGQEEVGRLLQRIFESADPFILCIAASGRFEKGKVEQAEQLALRAADIVSPDAEPAQILVMTVLEEVGRYADAQRLAFRTFDDGVSQNLVLLIVLRQAVGMNETADELARYAATAGDFGPAAMLAAIRERVGDYEGADRVARYAFDLGGSEIILFLSVLRETEGRSADADRLSRYGIDNGNSQAFEVVEEIRQKAPRGRSNGSA